MTGCRREGAMRRLVVAHEKERAVAIARGEPVQGQVGDEVGGVAAAVAQSVGADEVRVEVGALVRKHAPVVEARRPGARSLAEMPLAEDRGRVAARLARLGDVRPAIVEQVHERGNAVHMVIGSSPDRGAARRADRVCDIAVIEALAPLGDLVYAGRLADARHIGAYRLFGMYVGP